MAKATAEDFEAMRKFGNACELALDAGRFSLAEAADNWEDLDEDDADRKEIERMRKDIAEEEGIDEKNVDNRILMYEWLCQKYKPAGCSWNRVVWGAEIVIEAACDPTLTYLDFAPSIIHQHVAPEQ